MRHHAVIAVTPPAAAATRSRLLDALELAFPVRFERREYGPTAADVDAILAFGPSDETAFPSGIPTLVIDGQPLTGAPADITFTDSSAVDRRLRGRTLGESTRPSRQLPQNLDAEILAMRGSAPIWARRTDGGGRTIYLAASAPEELLPHEPLKARLRAGQFECLVPLVDFLRTVTAMYAWAPPPLRAMLMFDDPNLRWPSYGYIDYRKLLEHARLHDYHAAMAMIPIDGGLVHPMAARLYREHPDRLSLLMHGLKHVHRELVQPLPRAAREREAARALRSIEAFERRSRVNVSRVICAPHGEASEDYLATLLRFGVEALFADAPFPWPGGDERSTALTDWHAVNFVAESMPVIPRYPFVGDPDEIVLRAFLDHPLVLYGHHEDVAEGLQRLERAATLVNSLGTVQWSSATSIARQNVMTRREGSQLIVRLLARRVDVTAPADVNTVDVDLSLMGGNLDDDEVVVTNPGGQVTVRPAAGNDAIEVQAGRLTIEVRPRRRFDHHGVPAARPTPWPMLRRALTETRDRLRPLLR